MQKNVLIYLCWIIWEHFFHLKWWKISIPKLINAFLTLLNNACKCNNHSKYFLWIDFFTDMWLVVYIIQKRITSFWPCSLLDNTRDLKLEKMQFQISTITSKAKINVFWNFFITAPHRYPFRTTLLLKKFQKRLIF